MTKCMDCNKELNVVVPEGTDVCCSVCATNRNNLKEHLPKVTKLIPIKTMIKRYERRLADELMYFKHEISQPYTFEQAYSLLGLQRTIDELRNDLYWLKQLVGEEQSDVVIDEEELYE